MARPDLWVIDTSSIIAVRELVPKSDQTRVYDALAKLVSNDELVFPVEVFKELNHYTGTPSPSDKPYAWAKKHKSHACRWGTDHKRLAEMFRHPGGIGRVVDGSKVGVEDADPYVLELAWRFNNDHNVTVITEDFRDRDDKMSMATACGILRIVALHLVPFLATKGIWSKTLRGP